LSIWRDVAEFGNAVTWPRAAAVYNACACDGDTYAAAAADAAGVPG